MSADLHTKPNGKFEVRWRSNGRRLSKTFGLLRDAERFQSQIRRRKQLGGAAMQLHHLTRNDMGEQVYVVCGAERVKIGVSANPLSRLTDLQTGSPSPLAVVWRIACPNARALESALHERYAPHRTHGEWFEAVPVLADLRELAKLGAHQFAPENSGHSVDVSTQGGNAS